MRRHVAAVVLGAALLAGCGGDQAIERAEEVLGPDTDVGDAAQLGDRPLCTNASEYAYLGSVFVQGGDPDANLDGSLEDPGFAQAAVERTANVAAALSTQVPDDLETAASAAAGYWRTLAEVAGADGAYTAASIQAGVSAAVDAHPEIASTGESYFASLDDLCGDDPAYAEGLSPLS